MNTLTNVKGVKFAHMNTRSIFRKIDEIRLLYSEFDFICCSETWLDDRYADEMLRIDGMKLHRLDRPGNTRGRYRFNSGGGVCIFVNDKWSSYCSVYLHSTKSCPDIEIITLKIDKPNFKTFFVTSLYKPPKGNFSSGFKYISTMIDLHPNCEFWILGDFNIDFLKRNIPTTKTAMEDIRKSGLAQLIKNVTRPAHGKGTCIDWILTNSEYVALSFVSNHLISDHYPIVCVRKKEREFKAKEPKYIRLYNKLNFETLGNLLLDYDWSFYDLCNDVNEKWNILHTVVRDIIIIMCPLKKVYSRKVQPPWFQNSILKLIRERERLSRLFRNTGDSDVLRDFKIVRNKVTQSIRTARSSYINISLHRNKNNPRKFWRIIKDLQNKSDGVVYHGDFKEPLTGFSVPIDNVSMFLNDYFANIGSRLNTMNGTVLDDLDGIYEEMRGSNFSFLMVDRLDILMLEKDIDVTKHSCISDIRSDVCKFLFSKIPDKIASLFNTSLTTGDYPLDWSMGYVNLIPKQGVLSNPSNWRPITQTNIFGKNLEKIVHRHLLDYMLRHNILSDQQYGFLPGKSTHEAIFDLSRHIYSSVNNKKIMGLLFLDISKAFDCIIHERFLIKLSAIGCDQLVLSWFKSYLMRRQVVIYNDIKSNVISVPTGIGQGTILGPLIFIFYLNDIVDKLFYVKLSMYADDCVLYLSGNNWPTIRNKLQEDLECFEHWGELNNLHLNVRKTKVMLAGTRSKLLNLGDIEPLILYNNPISFVKEYNYLGVILDSEMNLRSFYNHVKKNVYVKIFAFSKLRNCLTDHAAILLYKLTILPFLEYAGFMLIARPIDDRRDLQKCQNDALRICLRVNLNDHVRIEYLHEKCKIVSLEQRRRAQLLSLMYKKRKDVSMHKKFARNTRRSKRTVFKTDTKQGNLYKRSPYFVGTKLWDSLSNDIIDLPDIFSFKARLKGTNKTYVDILK